MSAVHTRFPQLLITFHAVSGPTDMEAYTKRIGESARAIRQLISLSQMAAERGIRPPRFAYQFVIDEANKIISGVPFDDGPDDNAVWADVQTEIQGLLERNQVDQAQASELTDAARSALAGPFRSAYQALITWQEADRLNASQDREGRLGTPEWHRVLPRASCESDDDRPGPPTRSMKPGLLRSPAYATK